MGKILNHQKVNILLGLFAIILIGGSIWFDLSDYYGAISLVFLLLVMAQRFLKFEAQETKPADMMLIAILSALAAVSRVPFAGLPSIQPVSSIIILSALVFGSNMGFMIGAIAALVSNMFLGQGPWTPWQMFAWGSMGYMVGLISHKIKGRIPMAIIGFFLGILYGWIMNLWHIIGFLKVITIESVIAAYVSSFYFDLLHGLSNLILIYILYKPWMTILQRIKLKYGVH